MLTQLPALLHVPGPPVGSQWLRLHGEAQDLTAHTWQLLSTTPLELERVRQAQI